MLRVIVLITLLLAVVMPTAAQSSTYTVEYGDILDIIAAGFDASVECIAEASGLANPNKMRPGDVLRINSSCPPYDGLIPIERESSGDDDNQGGASSSSTRSGDYIVERGDVLDLIAAQFNVQVDCLAEANDLAPRMLIFPGDGIIIDTSCPPYDGEALNT
jgi:membrane-bound lytic murein transglycosylase D